MMPGIQCFLRLVILVLSSRFLEHVGAWVTDPLEVGVLKAVRRSLVDPMNKLNSWNAGDPCMSNWTGLACTGLPIDGYLHIQEIQLDNNNFNGSVIPSSYGNMTTLRKLSLRNCSLQGAIPDLSAIPRLRYMSLGNNFLTGSVPSIWNNMTFNWKDTLVLDFQNNLLTNISVIFNPPTNVSILLYGNPLCKNANQLNVTNLCQPEILKPASGYAARTTIRCSPCPTELNYENNPLSPIPCICAVPLGVGLRLKSPSISDFHPYIDDFEINLTSLLSLYLYQLFFSLYTWEEGPRLNIYLKLFPSNSSLFNESEVLRLQHKFTAWEITLSDTFGPYELLNFTLGSYANVIPTATESRLSTGALVGILLASIAGAFIFSALVTGVIMRRYPRCCVLPKKRSMSKSSIKVDDVKSFSVKEMALATKNFCNSMEVGRGGYGKVYKGILTDGTLVAIKRAQVESLQGSKEFFTEVELLSRLHHRNLVALLGYCDDEDEQIISDISMLVYEFMPNGTLRDHLSGLPRSGILSNP